MSSPTFPLSNVAQITVQVNPAAATAPTFNQGLIGGTSAVIPSTGGTNPRIRQYTSLAGMQSDGFTSSMPEYEAAELYFEQDDEYPSAQTLWVGRQDLTAIQTAIPHAGNAGTGYVVGDQITVIESGGTGGVLTVLTVGVSGNVTGLGTTIGNQGTGYSVGSGNSTSGGSGTGLEVDITAIGETPLQAIQACRARQPQWYPVYWTSAVTADHEAIAAWAQAATPPVVYCFNTSDAGVPNGTTGSILQYLNNLAYNRAFGMYSTTQGGAYPNNIYAAARAMGVAMGLNTGLADSCFTMKFKRLVGVAPEPLTETQKGNIEQFDGNILAGYANGAYSWLEQGTVANGQFFDEILFLDMLAAQIQYEEIDVLVDNNLVPLNDVGQQQLIHAAERVCQLFVAIGFLNPAASVCDHAYIEPAIVVLDIMMSDAMDSYSSGMWSGASSKSVSAFQTLKNLRDTRTFVTLTTRLYTYANMLVEFRATDTYKTATGLRARVTLSEIFLAGAASQSNNNSSRPQTTNSTNQGATSTQAPSTATITQHEVSISNPSLPSQVVSVLHNAPIPGGAGTWDSNNVGGVVKVYAGMGLNF